MNIVELSPRVRHAYRLADRTAGKQFIEARLGIGLQRTFDAGHMALGMRALPARRIREPHGSRFERTGTAVVAHGDLGLPVQRLVAGILGHQEIGQQVRMRDAARIGTLGAGGWAIGWHPAQIFLRRMVRISLKAAVMRPICSATSSPSGCMSPPQSG